MFWAMLHLTLAATGVLVLGVLAVRVGVEAARFGRAVEESTERIGRASGELERSAVRLAQDVPRR
ncbi:hypothetical protein ACWGIB_14600 [Streptomyces xiamenensis]